MKKLFLALLTFAGFATFAAAPYFVLDCRGDGVTIVDRGDVVPVQIRQDNVIVGRSLRCAVDKETTLKTILGAKKLTIHFRVGQQVKDTFEIKSLKVNDKELLEKPGLISRAQRPHRIVVEAEDGVMEFTIVASKLPSEKK